MDAKIGNMLEIIAKILNRLELDRTIEPAEFADNDYVGRISLESYEETIALAHDLAEWSLMLEANIQRLFAAECKHQLEIHAGTAYDYSSPMGF